jgi:hypothetical protein
VANTLAYCDSAKITTVKKLYSTGPGPWSALRAEFDSKYIFDATKKQPSLMSFDMSGL